MDEQLMTVTETARMLERSTQSVRGYEKAGRLPAIKTSGGMRLFRVTDVKKFAEKQRADRGSVA